MCSGRPRCSRESFSARRFRRAGGSISWWCSRSSRSWYPPCVRAPISPPRRSRRAWRSWLSAFPIAWRSWPRRARLAARVPDDLLSLAFGQLHDLRLRGLPDRLLASLTEDPVALALGLGEHFLAFLDDPASLLDLLGDRRAHLVEDVVDLLTVDADLVGERNGLRVVHEVVELVDEYEYVHVVAEVYSCGETGAPPFGCGNISRKRLATGSGTRSCTSPPKDATSFTPLEERKLYCGLDMRYIVSTSGARFLFRWCIWNSHSKSEIARSPFTIVLAPQ